MGANKLEAFEIETIHRRDINKADYNPRKITEAAEKKLRKFLRENGLWQPLIMNRRTGVLVSGHQRLTAMDSVMRTDDYSLTMAIVDVDEETEVKGNVFMNNQSAMGEFDFFALQGLHEIFPEISFEADLGFDASDVDFILGPQPKEEPKKNKEEQGADYFRAEKARIRENAQEENEEGSYQAHENDYQLTIVFPNNSDKREFLRRIGKKPEEKYIKSTVLYDLEHGVYSKLKGE